MHGRDWIENHFRGRTGRLLEIGACDGKFQSITCGLLDAGWEGVLVEPNPQNFLELQRNYGNNPGVRLVNAAVFDRDGLVNFWNDGGVAVSNHGVSTVMASHADTFKDRVSYTAYTMSAVSIRTLLRIFHEPFNFILIDAEGADARILKSMQLADMHDTEVIYVETARNPNDTVSCLRPYYEPVETQHPNIIAVRNKGDCQPWTRYPEAVSRLKEAKRVLVTGPQRSGTTIATKMLAADLSLPCLLEESFDTMDVAKFFAVAAGNEYVLQAPAMSAFCHHLPDTTVVFMRRKLTDILASQQRIRWTYGAIECSRYFRSNNEHPACIKYHFWDTQQKALLGHRAIDLEYESLRTHPLWLDKEKRVHFDSRRTEM